jgi:hypothetical protein
MKENNQSLHAASGFLSVQANGLSSFISFDYTSFVYIEYFPSEKVLKPASQMHCLSLVHIKTAHDC